jgi:hypothetical protein
VTKSAELRADSALAGTFCASKRLCPDYARYAVSHEADGLAVDPVGTCATHLALAVRAIWDGHHQAAVIQEIPGAWRHRIEGAQTRARAK